MASTPAEVAISFSTQITKRTSEALIEDVREEIDRGVGRVVLEVSTPGGEVSSGMMLYRALRSMKVELVTQNTSEVTSIGNMLFLAGETRLAYPESTFLIHPVALELGGRRLNVADVGTLRAGVERAHGEPELLHALDRGFVRLRREDAEMHAVLEERTKLTCSEIAKLVRSGEPFDASYALDAGIVHEIVPAPLGRA